MNDLYEIRYTRQMGRGVFAKKQIPINTKLIELDFKKYLVYGIVAEHVFFGKLCDFTQVNRRVHFAFYLAFSDKYRRYQKHYSPKVIRYIDNLPKQYHSLICWNQDELNQINDKILIKKTVQKKNRIYDDFLKLKRFLMESSDTLITPNYQNDNEYREQLDHYTQKSQEYINESDQTQPEQQLPEQIDAKQYKRLCQTITFQDFLNFYSAFETRYIYHETTLDSRSQLGALVPVLEMFNHCPEGQVKKQTYFLKTIKAIRKDEQIFVSYGDISNEELLLNYGFIIDENFDKIKNDYLPKILGSQTQQKEKQYACQQYRANLAKKYNKINHLRQRSTKQQTKQNKI